MSKRVLLGGLFHETHTFLEELTTIADFQVRRGIDLLAAAGDGSPLAGVLEVADARGWEILPTIDMRATPGATVEDRVVELFWEALERTYEQHRQSGVDGIFLVLHGAMVSQSHRDVEGDLLAHMRTLPGAADLPIAGVLDLHAHFSGAMAEHASALVAYRENPHTDAHAAAVQAAELLDRLLSSGEVPATVFKHPQLIWPPTGTGTADNPMRHLETMARTLEAEHDDILAVNVIAGYAFGDTPDTGVCLTAVTTGEASLAAAKLEEMAAWAAAHREEGNRLDEPAETVFERLATHQEGPVILVEPSDNIGGGAPGDGTTLLRAFVERKLERAVVVLNDPQAVAELSSLSPGEQKTLALGGKGNRLTDGPYELEVELLRTTDGQFDLEDRHSHLASMAGVHIDMGPCAVVRHGGVTVLLTSRKTPPFDLGQLRSQGIEPEEQFVIAVKAAVAHRQAYDPIARASYWVSTPGPCTSDLKSLPYEHVRRPVYPLDEIDAEKA